MIKFYPSLKILIYDDNAELLECMQLCLENQDFQVKTTSDKKHFYWLLDNFEPDALLIDVNLSGEDGRVICRMLKDDENYSAMPVILFSSSAGKLRDYLAYGADDVLEKPFEIRDVVSKLRAVIKPKLNTP
jgi:DNA-binding response OmpR family regulator